MKLHNAVARIIENGGVLLHIAFFTFFYTLDYWEMQFEFILLICDTLQVDAHLQQDAFTLQCRLKKMGLVTFEFML